MVPLTRRVHESWGRYKDFHARFRKIIRSVFRKVVLLTVIGIGQASAVENALTSTRGWIECNFKTGGNKPIATTIYVRNDNPKEKPLIGYKSGNSESVARPIENADGFTSERVAYAMFIEKIYGIELRRSVKVWLDDMTAELAVSSRTPGLTKWTSSEISKGTCIKVSTVTGLPK